MNDGSCGSISPDGKFGCSKLSGHHFAGIPECRNPTTKVAWCGLCGEWTCDMHKVKGQPVYTLSTYELDKLWGEDK